jgi:multiple sugar transport system permease protein
VFIGLQNYVDLLFDERFLKSIYVTLELIVFPVALQIGIGLLLAIVLKEKLPGTKWMRLAFILPSVIPPAVSGLVWKLFVVPGAGGLSYLFGSVGSDLQLDLLSAPSSALGVIVAASVWVGTPFVALLFLSALETIDTEQYEAARVDGATWLQSHVHLSLPAMRPAIVSVTIFRILEALWIFPIIFVLTGGGPAGATQPINYYAYVNGFQYLRVSYAATIIFFFFALLMVACAPFLVGVARSSKTAEG